MFRATAILLFCLLTACSHSFTIRVPAAAVNRLSGSEFYKKAAAMNWKSRDSLAVHEIIRGDIPGFLRHFVPITVAVTDSSTGQRISAIFYAAPDYLSVGEDGRASPDWARICITPMAAQQIADSLDCFLPTKKMVDDIYAAATVKLEPVPLFAYRDSTPSMWHHHLIIEGQRQGRKGLLAGIKKDVVISSRVSRDKQPGRVAIYGWHLPGGKPIQPLYTGHVNWYVDYSHGIRLIYRKIKLEGKWIDYREILAHPVWRKLLCDEPVCDFSRYSY